MNARYYLPGTGRFASADTIVPSPLNPQQFNRYTYALNSPLLFTDPSGHCAGIEGDPNSGDYDVDCWDFLENSFCTIVDCSGGDWSQWLLHTYALLTTHGPRIFNNAWTKVELETLANAIAAVQTALSSVGIDWTDTPLPQFDFAKGAHNLTFGRHITLFNITEQTIWHEMGHAIDAGFGRELHDIYDEETGNCRGLFCNSTAAPGYYYTDYGYDAFHSGFGELGGDIYGLFARQGETWADAFGAWVYNNKYGSDPTSWEDLSNANVTVDWAGIYNSVSVALDEKFK
jgi:hypothetical protein